MTGHDYEQGKQATILPLELASVVDGLAAGSVYGTTDAHVADFRLTYGTADKETVTGNVLENLTAAATAYRTELAAFVRTGQSNVGIPTYVTEEPAYNKRLPHEGVSPELTAWLSAAHSHAPESANHVMSDLTAVMVGNFDKAAYEATITSLFERPGDAALRTVSTLEHGGYRTVSATVARIRYYTTDPAIARTFMDSDFFATFGDDAQRLELCDHLVKLEDHEGSGPEGYSEDYSELLNLLEGEFVRHQPYIIAPAIGVIMTVAGRTPERITSLAQDYPRLATQLQSQAAKHILSLDTSSLTAEHLAALQHIEAALSNDIRAYTQLLDAYRQRDEGVDLDRLMHLAELLRKNPDTDPENRLTRSAVLVTACAPDDALPQLLAERPYITMDDRAKSIAVRRLARLGVVDQAMGLIGQETTTLDSWARARYPIRNLLAIYEESGDEQALAQANQRVEIYKSSLYADSSSLHEFAARRYLAACKYGYGDRAAEAAAEMETHHTSPDAYDREQALKLTLQMHLDTGEIERAAEYALRLSNDEQIQAQEPRGVRLGHDALLAIVHAYVKAGRHQEAAQFTSSHLLQQRPLNYHALWAIENIAKDGDSFLPHLYAPHLDPMHSNFLE